MLKSILRFATFETNSSSVHSFSVIPPDIARRWKDGEILLHFEDDIDKSSDTMSEQHVIELESVNGAGIYPDDPFSYEGYFPYAMFADEEVRKAWEDEGTLWHCELEEDGEGWIRATAIYMG